MVMDWEALFRSQILDRGYAYYLDGAVRNLQQTATQLTAQVQGSQRYQVTITLQAGEVQAMTCDCPYAAGQRNCKHMAAVLFAAEETATGDKDGDDSINDLIAQATTEQMRDFLRLVLPHNPTLAALFRNMSPTEPVRPIQPTIEVIDAICDQYTDQDFIDYENATPFADELLTYLDGDLTAALRDHQDQDVFAAVSHLLLVLDQLEIDDSDGEVMMLLDAETTLWTQLIHQAALPLKRRLFDWLRTQLQHPLDVIEETVQDLLFNADFTEPEFLTAKLALANDAIRRAYHLPDWERDGQVDRWTGLQLKAMVSAEVADADIEAFCRANVTRQRIRDYYVDFCLQRHRPQEAIALLQEGKRVNRDLSGVVCHDSQRLAAIYQQLGQTANYRQELWRLLTTYDPANLDDFQAYRAAFQASEWPAQRQKLLAALKAHVAPADLAPLYAHEKLEQPLLQAIITQDGLAGVRTYGPALKTKYAKQILKKYVATAQQAMRTTGTRQHYRQVVAMLREMATYPNGAIQAQQLVSEWQQAYPRRTAMLDELAKFEP